MSYGTTELPYTAARIKGIIKATGQITVKPAGLAGIQLDCNGATGDFTASITPANLTGNRRWILPNRDDTFAGLGAQTFTGRQIFNGGFAVSTTATDFGCELSAGSFFGWRNQADSGSGCFLLQSATNGLTLQQGAFTVIDSTASTSSTTGALVVTGGVGIGGRLNAAGHITGSAGLVVTGGIPGGVLAANVSTMDFDGTNYRFIAAGPNSSTRGRIVFQTCASDISLLASAITIDATPRVVLNIQTVVGTDPGGAELLRVGGTLAVNSATLIKTYTTLTDGAAAAVGTLTNAPTAGNPTKWVLINDNGVIRKFPTWT